MDEKTLYFEKISSQTENEIDCFIVSNPDFCVSYWAWRNCIALILKVYDELHDSVKEFGVKIDEILEPYRGKDISCFDQNKINSQLSKIGVLSNQKIHDKLSVLNKYHY